MKFFARGITKALSQFIKSTLSTNMELSDHWLRVSPNIKMVLRLVDKESSLCANCQKEIGGLFKK